MSGYPPGMTQATHDAAFDTGMDMAEFQATAERMADEAWELLSVGRAPCITSVSDWLDENGSEYVHQLVRGGDHYHAAIRDMRRDFTAWFAEAYSQEIKEEMGL
jgi:hypothetical protein